MANMIVVLSETVSRLQAQFRLPFFEQMRDNFKWGYRVAITDSIQANKGVCLVSSIIILLQFTSVYVLCHQLEHGRHFEITILGFNVMSAVFQMYKTHIAWKCTSHVIC